MKIIAAIAAMAAAASALELEGKTDVESTTSAETGSVAIVPESFDKAVSQFAFETPFTDQECYMKQVDIYSDQIIAIEALRLEVLELTQRISDAEHDFQMNTMRIKENRQKIMQNARAALENRAKIDVLSLDIDDIKDCLNRQWGEQTSLRRVLELYCHQFTFVSHLPSQCEPILSAGTELHALYAWPAGEHDEHYPEYQD